MVKHVILWQLQDELSKEEKQARAAKVKAGLEGLAGRIPGMRTITVITDKLETSNADMMLICTFENEEALKGYSVHPEHVQIAEKEIRPFYRTRVCMDYLVAEEAACDREGK